MTPGCRSSAPTSRSSRSIRATASSVTPISPMSSTTSAHGHRHADRCRRRPKASPRTSSASPSSATSRCSCTDRTWARRRRPGTRSRPTRIRTRRRTYGYLVRGKATNPIVADFLPILWSFGGDVFDSNWNVTIDNAASLRAVKFLVQDLKAAAPPGSESIDAADRSRLMAIGQAYQSTVWPGEITEIVENATVSQVKGKVSYIPMPAGPSGKGIGMMGNWLLGVPKASPNGQAAADFITWLTSSDTQKTYVDKGGIPARKSILNDAALNQRNPYFSALAKSLDAVPNWRPRTDQWNAVETILGTNLNAALAGLATPEDAVKKAADQIRTLMKGAGY